MSAQQHDALLPERVREVAALIHVDDQEIRIAEAVADVPHRHIGAELVGCEKQRPHHEVRDRERQQCARMPVHHRMHVRPRFIDRRMDEALQIGRPVVGAMDRAVEIEHHDVVAFNQFRAARAREQKRAGSVGCRTLTWP